MTIQEPKYLLHSEKALDIIFSNGEMRSIIRGYHRYFDVILNKFRDPDYRFTEREAFDLVDYKTNLPNWLTTISPDISIVGSQVLFHNNPINPNIMEDMLALYVAGKPYISSYLKFMENVAENGSEHARESIYSWVDYLKETKSPLIITEEGMLIAHRETTTYDVGTLVLTNDGDDTVEVLLNSREMGNERSYYAEIGAVVEMKYKPEPQDITPGIQGISLNAWSEIESSSGVRLEIHPKDVLSMDTQYDILVASRVLITDVDTKDNPPVSGVIPDPYRFGWLDEEFKQWENLGYAMDKALSFEAKGYSFEKSLMHMK